MKSDVKRINDRDLEELMTSEKKFFAVAFMSTFSIPCEHFRSELGALPELMGHRLKFYHIDVDENPTIVEHLGVLAVPTLVLYRDGDEIAKYEGPYSRAALKERMDGVLVKKKPKKAD